MTETNVAPWWWPRMRDILAWLSTLIFAGSYVAPMIKSHIDPQILASLNQYQGAIILQWGGMMGYYFGTSKSSGAKDDTISAMASHTPSVTTAISTPVNPNPT